MEKDQIRATCEATDCLSHELHTKLQSLGIESAKDDIMCVNNNGDNLYNKLAEGDGKPSHHTGREKMVHAYGCMQLF